MLFVISVRAVTVYKEDILSHFCCPRRKVGERVFEHSYVLSMTAFMLQQQS